MGRGGPLTWGYSYWFLFCGGGWGMDVLSAYQMYVALINALTAHWCSVPVPLFSSISHHVSLSPWLTDKPVLLLYSIESRPPMPRRSVASQRFDLLLTHIGARDHASASPTQQPLNIPGRTTQRPRRLQIHTCTPNLTASPPPPRSRNLRKLDAACV